jgi:hypothetical protein
MVELELAGLLRKVRPLVFDGRPQRYVALFATVQSYKPGNVVVGVVPVVTLRSQFVPVAGSINCKHRSVTRWLEYGRP